MTFSKRARLTLGIAVLLAPSRAAAEASASDIESARQLYNQAMDLRARGDQRGALEKFKAAHALGNTPITGLELCKAHASVAEPLEARQACLSVGRIQPTSNETQRSRDARAEAARLAEQQRARLATIRIVLSGVPAGAAASVFVDGAPVPPVALAEPRVLNPGRHDLSARVGTGPESKTAFDAAEGETKEITLVVEPPPAAPVPATAPLPVPAGSMPPEEPSRRTSPLLVAGLVVAGIGVGIGSATGLVAMKAKSDLDLRCPGGACGKNDHNTLDDARALADVSTASFVIGGLGLGLAAYGLLFPPSPAPRRSAAYGFSASPAIGPTSAGVHGTF